MTLILKCHYPSWVAIRLGILRLSHLLSKKCQARRHFDVLFNKRHGHLSKRGSIA